jgi:hypothetical protein
MASKRARRKLRLLKEYKSMPRPDFIEKYGLKIAEGCYHKA